MPRNVTVGVILLALLIGAAVTGAVENGADSSNPENTDPITSPDTNETGFTPSESNNYTQLYHNTIDSVVSIRAVEAGSQGSQGSGFVYRDGYIVTNEHVVDDFLEVEVRFSRGEWRRGDVVGTDVYTDLAVIEVNDVPEYAEPLPILKDEPKVGEPVAAIGTPFGFRGSITHGIVSGLNRSLPASGGFALPDMIQTDTPVNPGNSGGPLLSLDGKVVGVNRARTGDNLGFAISTTMVRRVVPELIEDGDYEHPYMGIRSIPVTPTVAEAINMEDPQGVLITEVVEGEPSDGILRGSDEEVVIDGVEVPVGGDVIVAINGTSIKSLEDLSNYLMTQTSPGDTIEVTVIRDGQRGTVELTLGTRPPP